jgi:hypothetical protein
MDEIIGHPPLQSEGFRLSNFPLHREKRSFPSASGPTVQTSPPWRMPRPLARCPRDPEGW